jgi:hypothetical protein
MALSLLRWSIPAQCYALVADCSSQHDWATLRRVIHVQAWPVFGRMGSVPRSLANPEGLRNWFAVRCRGVRQHAAGSTRKGKGKLMAKWKDAPPRPAWLARLPWRKRATWLIRDYLQNRIGTTDDKTVRAMYRGFLGKFDAATRDGNVAGIELDIMPVADDLLAVLIYPMIPGIGCVVWLPCLKTDMTERLADIVRETNPFGGPKLHHEPSSRKVGDPPRRGFPPKPVTKLYPGR